MRAGTWEVVYETDLARLRISASLMMYHKLGYLPYSTPAPFGGTLSSGEGIAPAALLLSRQILDPFALLNHVGTQGAFDPVGGLNDEVQGKDGHVGKPA